jgi:hypothetical protein
MKRYELRTIGTNHPEMKGKPHDEKFPHVAADIDSFGNLPPGSYKLEVEHGELYEETTFTFGESGIPDGDKIHAKVLPNNELTIRTMHIDPSLPTK